MLSFDNNTNLDWIGYSLDGQANKTILGNTTIHFPTNGSHTIQVFGNDSIGEVFFSDIRWFEVNTSIIQIDIISPGNTSYASPMSGYYYSTYGFEDTPDGSAPLGWTDRSDSGSYARVINGIGGHNKVIECCNVPTVSVIYLNQSFAPQVTGTIEWWWRKSSTETSCAKLNIYGDDGTVVAMALRMDWYYSPNKVEFDKSGAWTNTGYSYADDNHNGAPDCFLNTDWISKDYGADDYDDGYLDWYTNP